ncbi:MAG: hypothetical protein WDM86_18835 [Rhizomicrobium sp.]
MDAQKVQVANRKDKAARNVPPVRVKDQPMELFDGRLVNSKAICKILQCGPYRLSMMIGLPDGMPFIRIGARNWFDPEAVLTWLKTRQDQKNPKSKRR